MILSQPPLEAFFNVSMYTELLMSNLRVPTNLLSLAHNVSLNENIWAGTTRRLMFIVLSHPKVV